jgi:hypothetical protein
MSNKKDLNAYVRYDGTGRAVPSSLILNRFKPDVGNYKQVDAYECCNPIPPGCVGFDVLAEPGDTYFVIYVTAVDDSGVPVTGTVTWGDGITVSFSLDAGSSGQIEHTYAPGTYNGYICFSDASRVSGFSITLD